MKTYAEFAIARQRLYDAGHLGPAANDGGAPKCIEGWELEDAVAYDAWYNFHPDVVAKITGRDVETLTLDDRFPTGLPAWKATLYAQLYDIASTGKAPQWVYAAMIAMVDNPPPPPSNPYIRR